MIEGSSNPILSYTLVHFSTVSHSVLEDMAFSLINHTVHDQKRIQYLICVNHVAYAFLVVFSPGASPAMRRELRKSRRKYQDNMMAGIAHLDTSVRPDRSLLYALQSAVCPFLPSA